MQQSFIQDIRKSIFWGLNKVTWAKFTKFGLYIVMRAMGGWKHHLSGRITGNKPAPTHYNWEGRESTRTSLCLEGWDHRTRALFSCGVLSQTIRHLVTQLIHGPCSNSHGRSYILRLTWLHETLSQEITNKGWSASSVNTVLIVPTWGPKLSPPALIFKKYI